jgi:hypothetical protein
VRRIAYLIALVACCDLVAEGAAAGTPSYATNSNPVVFPKQAHPYGADMTTWGERAAAWIVGQPFAHNPLFDQTGADCANGQRGPVWFIPPIAGPHVFSGSRGCTIPADKAILLDIGHDLNDYPCPAAFGFEPNPGESLYDFLIRTDLPKRRFVALSRGRTRRRTRCPPKARPCDQPSWWETAFWASRRPSGHSSPQARDTAPVSRTVIRR